MTIQSELFLQSHLEINIYCSERYMSVDWKPQIYHRHLGGLVDEVL